MLAILDIILVDKTYRGRNFIKGFIYPGCLYSNFTKLLDVGSFFISGFLCCSGNVKNQTETDVDCGGICRTSNPCPPDDDCIIDADCASDSCTGGTCDDVCSDCLKVRFRNLTTQDPDQYMRLGPTIVNTGTYPVPLNQLELRYYFTNGTAPQTGHVVDCWYAEPPAQCATTTRSVVKMSTAGTNADFYVRVTWPSSSQVIQVGSQAGEWQLGARASDWTAYTQSNDYSYSGSTTVQDWSKVTLYQSGVKVWGTEP